MLGDADSVGAIAGQLAGAFYGYKQIDGTDRGGVHRGVDIGMPVNRQQCSLPCAHFLAGRAPQLSPCWPMAVAETQRSFVGIPDSLQTLPGVFFSSLGG